MLNTDNSLFYHYNTFPLTYSYVNLSRNYYTNTYIREGKEAEEKNTQQAQRGSEKQ